MSFTEQRLLQSACSCLDALEKALSVMSTHSTQLQEAEDDDMLFFIATVVPLMRPQKVTSKMVYQKGFALFGGPKAFGVTY